MKKNYSSNKKCFVCNRTRSEGRKLHRINKKSITKAFLDHNIILIHHSRCCKKHFDKNGIISNASLELMKLKNSNLSKQCVTMITAMRDECRRSKLALDQFKDINNLDESLCYKITGWTKAEFVRFSKYITSVNFTQDRTKEELVAIYRYWLRKGLDQTTLTLLRGMTSQTTISYYLKKIRLAINKDFVPYFLGAKSKERSFFVKHNTPNVIELYNLNSNDLCLVADGTYCQIEKSKNNQFQYDSYSGQKKSSLIKPFLICCADGYIIDCYGPFKATQNDAAIFEMILNNDRHLNNLTAQGRTFAFLDRGSNILLILVIFLNC